ncbi:MAG: hypothetical protein KAI71_06005 [Candidatus Pacebacteria bacterium]|nr:hypothetical protein [Candidatus Paceibacterota bacterium]
MKIVIGFDGAVFNTHKLIQELLDNLKKAGHKSEEFKEIYKKAKTKRSNFDQKEIIDLLIKFDLNNKMEVTTEITSLLEDSDDFIYSDFYKFVNNFRKKDLILFSSGTISFCKEKIEKLKINNFFNKIYITDNRMKKLELIYRKYSTERLFFIDDRASEIDQAERLLTGIVTIKIERSRGVCSNLKSERTNFVIKNLSQAEKIINELTSKDAYAFSLK